MTTKQKRNKLYVCWTGDLCVNPVTVCAWTAEEARTIFAKQMNVPKSTVKTRYDRTMEIPS